MIRTTFWSRFSFGTAPGDAEETRAFLQKRIGYYLGLIALLWVTISVTSMTTAMIYVPEMMHEAGAKRAGLVHNLGTLGLLVCWLVCKVGKRSLRTLNWLDAGTTIAQAFVMSTVMDAVNLRYRPDLSMSLGITCSLIARAAVVPSRGTRTLAIGVASGLPVVMAAIYTHSSLAPDRRLLPPVVGASQVGMWVAFAILLSTIISLVIYGLSRKVQEQARLGQYTLEKRIGEGAMGVVYLARHALLRRPTAIKLLAPGRAGERALARFEREVQTTAGLRHPNTVAIYDYGRTPEGVFYYAMEYLDGVDLDRLVTIERGLPEGRVVHILIQVARALDEAHTAGLIHRDIKPSNVILCDHGHQPDFVKVLDFGLVKELAGDASASAVDTLTGTPLYMSPESIVTPNDIDARSDLYSLGGLAYALLTGEPPFTGRTAVEVCGHHLHTPPEPPSRRRHAPVTPELEAVVLSCLAKDRAQRPASAAELARQLAACPVPPWTDADARAWWDRRGAELRASAFRAGSAVSDTVAVDLAGRAAV